MAPNNTERLANWIKVAGQAALAGNTPASLRQYSFAFDENAKRITLKAEVDRALQEDELEDLDVAETEMYSESFFQDEEVIETLVEVVPPPDLLSPLPGGVIYSREASSW